MYYIANFNFGFLSNVDPRIYVNDHSNALGFYTIKDAKNVALPGEEIINFVASKGQQTHGSPSN